MSNNSQKAYRVGQSIWYDNIERRLLDSGELKRMIEAGEIYGVTSNPSIFEKAIVETPDYDEAIRPLAWAGCSVEQVFDSLALEDIQRAADLFLPVYHATQGKDGFVSLEVNPFFAADTEATLTEAQRLWRQVERPNLMVKIPATRAGIPAIRQAIAAGINVNVTLIFSVERYSAVIDAYLEGLEDRLQKGLPIHQIASVASFFVSRVDTKVDAMLEQRVTAGHLAAAHAAELRGKSGLANSQLAYQLFREKFSSARYRRLQDAGAFVQRPLWASTSTKNPAYPDVLYIDGLVASDTVNTVPPKTLLAFLNHGKPEIGFDPASRAPGHHLERLLEAGIDIQQVTNELEEEGVLAFSRSYQSLLQSLQERMDRFVQRLGGLGSHLASRLEWHAQNRTIARLFDRDATLWSANPNAPEITNRLGWLALPVESQQMIHHLERFMEDITAAGYDQAVLLGMGGSSLAPEVFARVSGSLIPPENRCGLSLHVLDSTDPLQIEQVLKSIDLRSTLFIVSSKSGTTTETLALMEFFWHKVHALQGVHTGDQFIAITDPGTPLAYIASERSFRSVFHANPEVGGRYSALSSFGLVPARLLGLELDPLLLEAERVMQRCRPAAPAEQNPGLLLGVLLAEGARQGQDKLSFLADPALTSFGAWAEQLVAESSGKEGRGIIPVDQESLLPIDAYAQDRLFVYLRSDGACQAAADRLAAAGHPVIDIPIGRFPELASLFYTWEIAVAVACADLHVNAFDQPDVQDNKDRTRQKVHQIEQEGHLDWGDPLFEDARFSLYGQPGSEPARPESLIQSLLTELQPGGYLAINAFLPRIPEIEELLQQLRVKISIQYRTTVTLGFGPRYLHSTGQLHKGGPDTGVFLVLTYSPGTDLAIPGSGLQFGSLLEAQASGDVDALQARGRRTLHVHLRNLSSLAILGEWFESEG